MLDNSWPGSPVLSVRNLAGEAEGVQAPIIFLRVATILEYPGLSVGGVEDYVLYVEKATDTAGGNFLLFL